MATTGTTPAGPITKFLQVTIEKGNWKNVEPKYDGMPQVEKEIALIKSRLPSEHPLNSKSLEVDKGGTIDEDNGSTEIDEEEEASEFNYYITRQARISARGSKNKGGIRVKGRS